MHVDREVIVTEEVCMHAKTLIATEKKSAETRRDSV